MTKINDIDIYRIKSAIRNLNRKKFKIASNKMPVTQESTNMFYFQEDIRFELMGISEMVNVKIEFHHGGTKKVKFRFNDDNDGQLFYYIRARHLMLIEENLPKLVMKEIKLQIMQNQEDWRKPSFAIDLDSHESVNIIVKKKSNGKVAQLGSQVHHFA